MAQYSVKKIGVRFKPPTLIIDYLVIETGSFRRRVMPVRGLKSKDVTEVAKELKQHHAAYLESIPSNKVSNFLFIIPLQLIRHRWRH